jgi:hypothetical protein
MELVEGETLAQRLVKGALPTAAVLKLGGQIAIPRSGAHRHGHGLAEPSSASRGSGETFESPHVPRPQTFSARTR